MRTISSSGSILLLLNKLFVESVRIKRSLLTTYSYKNSFEDVVRLKQLSRFRYGIVDQTSDIKRKVIASLDQVFPEYEALFSDMFGKSSTQLLLRSPLPEDLLAIDSQKLIELLNVASSGRLTLEKSTTQVHQLKKLAQDSFGIRVATDVYKLQIQLLLQQILLLEEQLKTIENEMS